MKKLLTRSKSNIKKGKYLNNSSSSSHLIKLWREKNGMKIKKWDELKTLRRFREKIG